MEYNAKKDGRIQTSKFLHIHPSILRTDGAMISLDVSNKSAANFGSPEDFIEKIDLQVIYTRTDWNNADIKNRLNLAKKCEILIPNIISVDYIKNL